LPVPFQLSDSESLGSFSLDFHPGVFSFPFDVAVKIFLSLFSSCAVRSLLSLPFFFFHFSVLASSLVTILLLFDRASVCVELCNHPIGRPSSRTFSARSPGPFPPRNIGIPPGSPVPPHSVLPQFFDLMSKTHMTDAEMTACTFAFPPAHSAPLKVFLPFSSF